MQDPPNPAPKGASDLELSAYLSRDATFVGQLSFAGNARIDGAFDGQVQGGEVVVLGPSSRISGKISARRVVILGGHIEADILARESVEIRPGAEVLGALISPEILVDPGAKFSGTFQTQPPPEVS